MDSLFENRYVVSKKVLLEWAKRPVTKDVFTYMWGVLAIVIIAFTVIWAIYGDIFYSLFSSFMEMFCIYRIFFRKKLLLSKQFRNIAITQGKNEWERTIKFADKILVIDGNTNGEYEWSQVKEFVIDREYLILILGKRLGIRISKLGFIKGTCELFIDYVKNEHNCIPIKVRK